MSDHHISEILRRLDVGSEVPVTLEDFRMEEAPIRNLSDEWVLDQEDETYDGTCIGDEPVELKGIGMFLGTNGKLYITGDGGMFMFFFRLSR